jgi:hypothetical protein
VDVSRLSRLTIAPVVGCSGCLNEVTCSRGNLALVHHLISGPKKTSETSTLNLIDHNTPPNGFLNQGRQHHG